MYQSLKKNWKGTNDELFGDLLSFLLGGNETPSKTLSNCILFMKRNPECEQKLRKEIDDVLLKNRPLDKSNLSQFLNKESLDEMDYLNIFLKEVLRLSSPSARSLGYKALDHFETKDGV